MKRTKSILSLVLVLFWAFAGISEAGEVVLAKQGVRIYDAQYRCSNCDTQQEFISRDTSLFFRNINHGITITITDIQIYRPDGVLDTPTFPSHLTLPIVLPPHSTTQLRLGDAGIEPIPGYGQGGHGRFTVYVFWSASARGAALCGEGTLNGYNSEGKLRVKEHMSAQDCLKGQKLVVPYKETGRR